MDAFQFEHIKAVCNRPSMYVSPGTLENVYAYICGLDEATGCLTGFREWLVTRFDEGNNLHWTGLLNLLFAAETRPESDRMRRLEKLFAEFYEFTHENGGHRVDLTRVYLRYHAWLLNRTWYDHEWAGYIAPYDGIEVKAPEENGG